MAVAPHLDRDRERGVCLRRADRPKPGPRLARSGRYQLRNRLAHRRLPDIDEDEVWRMTQLRPERLHRHVDELLL